MRDALHRPHKAFQIKLPKAGTIPPVPQPTPVPFVPPYLLMPKTTETCVLFLHHNNSPVTLKHLATVRETNPSATVVPISFGPSGVPDSVDVTNSYFAGEGPWYGADAAYYTYFRNPKVKAQRYILMEYDVLATLPLSKFFAPVWNSDAVGTDIRIYGRDRWGWFKDMKKMPKAWKERAAGIAPGCLHLISGRCADAMAELTYPKFVYSELRMGTAIRMAGFEPERHPFAHKTIHWIPSKCNLRRDIAGVYHPVKTLPSSH